MKFIYYLRRALTTPLHRTVQKAVILATRWLALIGPRWHDRINSTYATREVGYLNRYLSDMPTDLLRGRAVTISALAEHFLQHRFDLLGSGWVNVRHGMDCQGLEGCRFDSGAPVAPDVHGDWLKGQINASNLPEARRIWQRVDPAYVPIDWQLDFKSSFSWSATTWSSDIIYGREAGADVKVPWELARCQHMPQLAFAYALAKDGEPGLDASEVYLGEFRNQVLDFMATNPPRYGVNWSCTMDVAIRVANWLATYDLFLAFGADFDAEFRSLFNRSIHEHGQHIVSHLEWNSELRGNHYLADIVGLLFVSSYLPSEPETNSWLALAIQELVAEQGSQFNPDGSTFEASTSYHRLSMEMVVYAIALILGLPDEKRAALDTYANNLFPSEPKLALAPLPTHLHAGFKAPLHFPTAAIESLPKMAEFTIDVTKPNGEVIQIGDNDNGRFFKFHPVFIESTDDDLNENYLDHRPLVALTNGLLGRNDFTAFTGGGWIDEKIAQCLAKGQRFSGHLQVEEPSTEISAGAGLNEDLRFVAYPDFGLYIYRSSRLYLAIRCGPNGQNGFGGHAHNDNLSFELALDGVPIFIDPGSYLYTPLPDQRNHFRSTAMHNTVFLATQEQNQWRSGPSGLFLLKDQLRRNVITPAPNRFSGEYQGNGVHHKRDITVLENGLEGIDSCTVPGRKYVSFNLHPNLAPQISTDQRIVQLTGMGCSVTVSAQSGRFHLEQGSYSRGYGCIQESDAIYLEFEHEEIHWTITGGSL